MANPTTNFGWQMPQNTDLVKDLPADFEVFGQAVDTDLADLKGGTTGQVLSKTTNTDLDFTWVTPTDQTPLTTKGDLFTYTTQDARLGVGANGTVLTADSAEATGLKWAAVSGAMSYITGASFSAVSSFSLPNSTFTATYDNYFLMLNITDASATTNLNVRMRSAGADYTGTNYNYRYGITDTSGSQNYDGGTGTSAIVIAGTTTTADRLAYPLFIFAPYLTASTKIMGTWWGSYGGNNGAVFGGGVQHTASSYDSLSVFVSSGTFQGDYKLYGIVNS